MPEVDDLSTSDVSQGDVSSSANGETSNSGEATQNEQPFLAVNDRTSYKTREDAVKAYNEAGQRISALAPWEKAAQQWGLQNPAQLDQVARELLELRQLKQEMAKKEAASKGQEDSTKRFADAGLDPKQAAEVQKYLDKLGYVPKSVVDEIKAELKSEIDGLRQHSQQSTEQSFRHQEATAREQISSWLKEGKLSDDGGTRAKIVGSLIKAAIDESDPNDPSSYISRWSQGGPEALAMVKELYDLAIKDLPWTASATPAPGSPEYAAAKKNAVAANKKLPTPGTATKKVGGDSQPAARPGSGDYVKNMHERAREEFEKVLAGA
jgi:hypothetical protein